ncbi:response regulator transcription factor [Microvirga sp. KLBC 81]|uniref:LuxR C-terminal-related transcriptional regulator n=1 Tax=Microvirga sp. KLBC 81 TaxID=1862707 RepID=UPI0014022E9C|nr:response regulator transcription factor [Microvirga sp. KLBC 81]
MSTAESCITRVHIYASSLLRTGVEQILDGTRFIVVDPALQSLSQPSALHKPAAELFILDGTDRPNEILDLIPELKAQNAAARVIVLADHFDIHAVALARHAGANGFCLTTSSRDVLVRSIELVMLGEIVVPSELVLAMIEDSIRSINCPPWPSPEKLINAAPRSPLSSRELEVLGWLREGAPNKVIARRLDMAEATVKVHVKAILRKIGAHNRAQAAIWAAYHLPLEAAIE